MSWAMSGAKSEVTFGMFGVCLVLFGVVRGMFGVRHKVGVGLQHACACLLSAGCRACWVYWPEAPCNYLATSVVAHVADLNATGFAC